MTKGEDKTKEQLISELAEMHQRIAEVKVSETERKQAEEQLQTLLDNIPFGVSLLNQKGSYEYVNARFTDIFGYTLKDIPTGKEWLEKAYPDQQYRRKVIASWLNDLRKAGVAEARPQTFIVTCKDGSTKDIQFRPITLSKGQQLVTYEDITERKEMEEEVYKLSQLQEKVLDNANVWIDVLDEKANVVLWNKAAEEISGYSAEEVIGHGKIWKWLYPDEEYQREITAKAAAIIEREAVENFETTIRTKDGQTRVISWNSRNLVDEDGTPTGSVALGRDVTERKEAEELYSTLANSSQIGVYIVQDRKFQFVNPYFQKVVGLDKDDLLGTDLLATVHPEDREMARQNAVGMLKGKRSRPYEFKIIDAQGKVIVVMEVVTSVEYKQKRATLASFMDITERKQMEAEKKELEQQAQVASRLATVGEMASGIAHEINNPLTAVIGYADLVLERDIPEEAKNDVRIIHNGAKRVADIVKRLLAFAHQYQPERTYLDINDIIKTTLELRAYELETSNIKATTNLAPDLPRTMADAGQLQQVFLNLIINAETEMRLAHGGGKLSVKTETVGSTIRISFKDDGPGITKENLEKIFNPFFTTREVGKGTGLGLSLCHGIIAEHKGRLYAESKPGKGATFVVELPVITEEKQLEMAEPAEEVKEVAPARILVVDDEPAICQFLKRVLTGEGHEVETVASAGDALERIKGTRYNLILLDIKLPDKSGIELYKHIKDATPSWAKRIVFITGDVMGTDTRSFLSRTRVPYITKPFDTKQLKRDINRKLTEGAQDFKKDSQIRITIVKQEGFE